MITRYYFYSYEVVGSPKHGFGMVEVKSVFKNPTKALFDLKNKLLNFHTAKEINIKVFNRV